MTRKLILNYKGKFLTPSYILEEFEKHKELLLKKSKLNKSELEKLLSALIEKLNVVSQDKLDKHKLQAIEIMGKIDMNDITFIECALAYPGCVIWSDDDHFKMQKEIYAFTTKEIINLIQ